MVVCSTSTASLWIVSDRRDQWNVAVLEKLAAPHRIHMICSCHFVGEGQSDDPIWPSYVPFSLLDHNITKSPAKEKLNANQQDKSIQVCVRGDVHKHSMKKLPVAS